MSAIPSNISRAPNLLWSQMFLGNLNRTNIDLLTLQSNMATGHRVNRFSDDSVAASAISVLQDRMARGEQRLQNLSLAEGTLAFLDSRLGDASELILEAKSIASEQIGVGSDQTSRTQQAGIIDGMIRSLYQNANRETNGVYVFGGSTATRPPVEEMRGGFRYVGRGSGMLADLDGWDDIPITIGGENAIGEVSARQRSALDLDPALAADTRLRDLRGARGLGVRLGEIGFSFDGGPQAAVDLSGADTVQDVIDALTAGIRRYETDNGVTILGPAGVHLSGDRLAVDVVAGGPPDPQLTFADLGTGVTAADLGLLGAPFEATVSDGLDVDPKLTLLTPLSAIPGLTVPAGSIRVRFTTGGTSSITDVDLSTAQTIDDVRSLIETSVPGVRVEVNAAGTGLDIFNEVSGPAMSVEEVPGGPDTATELGIRTISASTPTSLFNDGRGVRIVDGVVDPDTGLPTRALNVDFRITLGNGQAFDVDLRPQDMASVQTVLDRINQEFADALLQPPLVGTAPALAAGDFSAGLAPGQNGIALTQTVAGGPVSVGQQNNSAALQDLGLSRATWDAGSASLIAQDRAGVRVNNLFTALIDLRDQLRLNDSVGITVAGELLERSVDRIASTRALVGVNAQRVERAKERQLDSQTFDETMRSGLQDLDYAETSLRFNLLRTQLQAAMTSGSQAQSLTLLDFLG